LKALVFGGFVRGLSMRDVESLCEEAGLGRTSKSTVATICSELHERFEAFCRRSLYDVNLVVLFLDAIYLPVRSHPRAGAHVIEARAAGAASGPRRRAAAPDGALALAHRDKTPPRIG
jgi:transposase-like protein